MREVVAGLARVQPNCVQRPNSGEFGDKNTSQRCLVGLGDYWSVTPGVALGAPQQRRPRSPPGCHSTPRLGAFCMRNIGAILVAAERKRGCARISSLLPMSPRDSALLLHGQVYDYPFADSTFGGQGNSHRLTCFPTAANDRCTVPKAAKKRFVLSLKAHMKGTIGPWFERPFHWHIVLAAVERQSFDLGRERSSGPCLRRRR